MNWAVRLLNRSRADDSEPSTPEAPVVVHVDDLDLDREQGGGAGQVPDDGSILAASSPTRSPASSMLMGPYSSLICSPVSGPQPMP